MSATLNDICRETGLSKATISRVLNESPLVKEDTKKRVVEAMSRLDYHPSRAARMLARRKTDTLGVIFPHLDSGFYTEVLLGVDKIASERGYHLMTAFSHGIEEEESLVMRFLTERMADALVLLNLDLPDAFLLSLASQSIPIVLIDKPATGDAFVSVTIDNISGAADCYRHLIEQGYRDIFILSGPADSLDSQERIEGCRRVAREAGITWDEKRVVAAGFEEEAGYQTIAALCDRAAPLPDAIFAMNDAMALGAMVALKEHGLRVGKDVALAGFDDSAAARYVGLTTVHIPMREMGRVAGLAAINRITQKPQDRLIQMPTHLVIRESTSKDENG